MMYVCGRGKDDFLTSTVGPSTPNGMGFKLWKFENNMTMSWLINSMRLEIGENFLLYPTAHAILGGNP